MDAQAHMHLLYGTKAGGHSISGRLKVQQHNDTHAHRKRDKSSTKTWSALTHNNLCHTRISLRHTDTLTTNRYMWLNHPLVPKASHVENEISGMDTRIENGKKKKKRVEWKIKKMKHLQWLCKYSFCAFLWTWWLAGQIQQMNNL